ncbi:MAG: transposase [Chloroflexi bacterium]|nr:transposase [Chloroflexota bacterium]
MRYDPDRHHRRSIRLKGYDYRQAGAYFVTIVTQDRACLFGEAIDGGMQLNDAGRMVEITWTELPGRFPGLDLDAFVVMPNHVHAIMVVASPAFVGTPLVGVLPVNAQSPTPERAAATGSADDGPTDAGGTDAGGTDGRTPTRGVPTSGSGVGRGAPTLGDIVGAYKSLVTLHYTRGVKANGWPEFRGRVWQLNYYEHIIRDEPELDRIRRYIDENPARWAEDDENPAGLHRTMTP